jgi:hypothetical protein
MSDPRPPSQPAQPFPRQPAQQQQQPMPGLRPPGSPMNLSTGQPAARPAVAPQRAQVLPRQAAGQTINPAATRMHDEDAIELLEEADEAAVAQPAAGAISLPGTSHTPGSKIKFGAELGLKKHDWKRQLSPGGTGACRVRTFHGKLSDQGLDYIDEAINVWLDDHAEINVKFVTTTVGMFDGKFKDLALIVNVWY